MTPKDTAEMFKELDAITEGTGLNVKTTKELLEKDGSYNPPLSFDEKLDEILVAFYNGASNDVYSDNNHDGTVYTKAGTQAKQAIKQLIASELGAIIDANIDPDYAVDTDAVYEVLMEWLGELQGGGDE